MANTGVSSGTYGTSTSIPTITIDSKGRITSASTTNIPNATSSVTGLLTSSDYNTFNAKQNALTLGTGIQTFLAIPTSSNLAAAISDEVGSSSLVFSNNPTITNAVLTGTLTLTTPLITVNGGTGINSYNTGDILYASAANTLSKLGIGSAGQVLTVSSGIPSWGSNGLYSLNGITSGAHVFATGSSGTDFNISSAGSTHTFNIPDAGATATTRGLVNIGTQTFYGNKTFNGTTNVTTLIASGWLSTPNLKVSGSSPTVGAILTAAVADGTTTWSTNISVGALTSTFLSTGTLKVTGGNYTTTGAVLTNDGNGNATWGSNGLYSLNGQTATTHNFATGSSGIDFNISTTALSGTATHTFNIPDASVTSRGVVNTGTQTFAGSKTFSGTLSATSLTVSSSITAGAVTYPNVHGTSGQILTTTGSGTLTWTSASAGISGVGSIAGSSNANGVTVSGNTLNLTPADATNGGVLTNGTQTIAGQKSFSKAVTNSVAYNAGSSTTIDFSQSNLAYTTANPGAFTLTNMKDGGTYTLAVQGTTSGTASFTGSGFTGVSLGNYSTISGKQTVYTFVVMGSTFYYTMVSQQ